MYISLYAHIRRVLSMCMRMCPSHTYTRVFPSMHMRIYARRIIHIPVYMQCLYVSMHVHTCIPIHTHAWICIHIHSCMIVHIRTYACVSICVLHVHHSTHIHGLHRYEHVCIPIHIQHMYFPTAYIHTCIVCMRACIPFNPRAYVPAKLEHMDMNTYAHTHTHTHTHRLPRL
jgi:hypothetical protein